MPQHISLKNNFKASDKELILIDKLTWKEIKHSLIIYRWYLNKLVNLICTNTIKWEINFMLTFKQFPYRLSKQSTVYDVLEELLISFIN